jgi:poly-gamma-glutamate capsule biosynthesis protein CapA/YwtB (metallophosphatase superfamily)
MLMKIVRPYTIKGKILCGVLSVLLFPIHLFKNKQWLRPRLFEENPKTMTFKDIVYFAYKYYFKSSVLPSRDSDKLGFEKNVLESRIKVPDVSISIGGDLMPYEMIQANNCQSLWDEVGSDFFGSDLVFANLETPLDTSQKPSFVPEVMLNDMHFNTDESTFNIFSGNGKFRGYDILSVANNHSMDMGESGLDSTLDFLKRKGILAVGAKQLEEEDGFCIKVVNGIKIGFVAYTYSLNQLEVPKGKEWKVNVLPLNTIDCDVQLIQKHIETCRSKGAEFVVCSLHCGNAYQAYPSSNTIDLYQKVFETCGPDVIAGGHPHNLQPWKYFDYHDSKTGKSKKGFAIFSLADFIAYDIYTWCHLSAYLKIILKRLENNEIDFEVMVHPLYMERRGSKLKLKYATELFRSNELSGEIKDIKILYDICYNE